MYLHSGCTVTILPQGIKKWDWKTVGPVEFAINVQGLIWLIRESLLLSGGQIFWVEWFLFDFHPRTENTMDNWKYSRTVAFLDKHTGITKMMVHTRIYTLFFFKTSAKCPDLQG